KDAQPVEEVLKNTSTAEKRLQTVGKVGAVRQLRQKCRVKETVEDVRSARDDCREPRSGSHDRGKQVEQTRVRLQKREKLDARRQTRKEPVETHQCLV